MRVVGIDPGPSLEQTHAAIVDALEAGAGWPSWPTVVKCSSVEDAIGYLVSGIRPDLVVMERIVSFGVAGNAVFATATFSGIAAERIHQATGSPVAFVPRDDVRRHFGVRMRKKGDGKIPSPDAQIRAALLDQIGPTGTVKNPGPTYEVKRAGGSHNWAALALAMFGVAMLRGTSGSLHDAAFIGRYLRLGELEPGR